MKSFKAPGPDGYQPFFFNTYWDIVGEDVWRLVRDAFDHGYIDPRIAETLIVLILKVDQPTRLTQFRPISLCNTIYKLITKVFVNKLRPLLMPSLRGRFFIICIDLKANQGVWLLKLI